MGKKYKCKYCNARLERKQLINHIDKEHASLLPEGYSSTKLVYTMINKRDHGICRVCKKDTQWNEKSGRFDVLCGDPKCKEKMREEYKKNMLRVRGTYNILTDPEQQKTMLANRKISGAYRFQDGGVLTYTGTYEKKCLEFMDIVMNIPSKDILSPGPTLEYEYNGEKHFYITDFYYIPYNLIIEVKDGGDNPNNKHSVGMNSSRERTIQKERLITDRGEYNYIRLTNNNFAQLIEVFMIIKEKLLEGNESKTYRINENAIIENYFTENNILNNKDIYYNKNKFDTGEVNLCFIIGHSGSGKSTMARDISNNSKNIEYYELDDLISNWNFSNENLREYGDLYYSFFNGVGNKYRYKTESDFYNDNKWKNTNDYVNSYEACLIKDFIKYAKEYASFHKNIKFILEGIWIFYFLNPEALDNYAVYIKGTSIIVSKIRAAKRDSQNVNGSVNKLKYFIKLGILTEWDKYKYSESRLIKFRNYFINKAAKSLNESVVLESEDRSILDKNFIPKRINIPYEIIDIRNPRCYKYIKKYISRNHPIWKPVYDENSYIKSLNGENENHDIGFGEIIINAENNELIGYELVQYENGTSNKWLAIDIPLIKYRGYGFGKLLLVDAVYKHKCNCLYVAKDNEIAFNMYKNMGFVVRKDTFDGEYLVMQLNKNINESVIVTCNDSILSHKFDIYIRQIQKYYKCNDINIKIKIINSIQQFVMIRESMEINKTNKLVEDSLFIKDDTLYILNESLYNDIYCDYITLVKYGLTYIMLSNTYKDIDIENKTIDAISIVESGLYKYNNYIYAPKPMKRADKVSKIIYNRNYNELVKILTKRLWIFD